MQSLFQCSCRRSFRGGGGDHKNDSTKWKNNTNNKIIPEFTENGNKLNQINTTKSNSRFAGKGSNY